MSIRTTSRITRVALAMLALVTLSFTAPAAFARGSFGISVSVPGIAIGYSDYGRHGRWNGYASGGYSSYGGYYGGSPYYSSYNDPYYQSYYRPAYRNYYGGGYYGGRNSYRPSRVVYYDRGGYRDHRGGRYDNDHGRSYRGSHGDRGRHDRRRDDRRGGYYDRGH